MELRVRAERPMSGELRALYDAVGWSAYTDVPGQLERAIQGSSLVLTARDGAGRLVGLARTVSDGTTIVYVQDVLVAPAAQGQGVGGALLDEVLRRAADIRQVVLLTDAEPLQRAFYEAHGLVETQDVRPAQLRSFVRLASPAPTPAWVVRHAGVEDAEGIARVHATSWRETYGRFVDDPDTHPWFDVDRRIAMWRTELARGAFPTVVVTDQTGVVGFAAVQTVTEPDAVRPEELTMLYVLARAHGTGAGQTLLDAALGDRPASLWVAADNPRAHAFYRRNGFVADGTTSSFGPIATTVRLVR
ncbi:GNAT family N-acetyltransferase [Curtobacterium sp. Leaf183]|uniref:GNAT family N-acetyltransferase n=1 Tax=Curtobacterium sp. Leaf183 TaxID=1736291 RepID=UPI000B2AACFF|nr:GNAT family N-acetyltransferase [Curtobacterium sp. Leaf183]